MAAGLLAVAATAATAEPQGPAALGDRTAAIAVEPDRDFSTFLDRLMAAESGGRALARNPRSTALGSYQFLRQTFLDIARRHLGAETSGLTEPQILALRIDTAIARKAAAGHARDNAIALQQAGHASTYGNLRLAHLLGAGAASRILAADGQTTLARLLPPSVIAANPFMASMTAAALIERSHRDISMNPARRLAVTAAKAKSAPSFVIPCSTALASCRRWVALETRMRARQVARR